MTAKVIFQSAAENDLKAAFDYYERCQPSLGKSFVKQLDHSIKRICQFPNQHPLIYKNVRRALLKRFPFAVFYLNDSTQITVIAIFHCGRHPSQWQTRFLSE